MMIGSRLPSVEMAPHSYEHSLNRSSSGSPAPYRHAHSAQAELTRISSASQLRERLISRSCASVDSLHGIEQSKTIDASIEKPAIALLERLSEGDEKERASTWLNAFGNRRHGRSDTPEDVSAELIACLGHVGHKTGHQEILKHAIRELFSETSDQADSIVEKALPRIKQHLASLKSNREKDEYVKNLFHISDKAPITLQMGLMMVTHKYVTGSQDEAVVEAFLAAQALTFQRLSHELIMQSFTMTHQLQALRITDPMPLSHVQIKSTSM